MKHRIIIWQKDTRKHFSSKKANKLPLFRIIGQLNYYLQLHKLPYKYFINKKDIKNKND